MRYLTDRKRAEGRGASGRGTEHHWYMQATAVVLAFMVPWFMYFFGVALGFDFVPCLHDPAIALSPGGDGLEPYRVIAAQAPAFLAKDGRVIVEKLD